jgi:hypothetical protein
MCVPEKRRVLLLDAQQLLNGWMLTERGSRVGINGLLGASVVFGFNQEKEKKAG